jgi:hypothetical protein
MAFGTSFRDLCEVVKRAEAEIVYTVLSPEVHRILTSERRWSTDRYERWLARSLRGLMVTPG